MYPAWDATNENPSFMYLARGYEYAVEQLLRVDVLCDLTAPAVVRDALAQTEEIEPVLDDATLIASELVTNAVIHSGCSANDVIQVRVSRGTGRLTISVCDPGASGKHAEMTHGNMAGYGGFGLKVVDAVALRWGTERDDGYRVWAELALSGGECCLAGA
jgi:anti-sigma regulatory factor (Ser/Thr protein kinase)